MPATSFAIAIVAPSGCLSGWQLSLLSPVRAGHCLACCNLGMTNGFELIRTLTFITDSHTWSSCLTHEICHTYGMYSSHWAYVYQLHEQITRGYCKKVHCLLLHEKLDGLCTQERYAHEPLPFQ